MANKKEATMPDPKKPEKISIGPVTSTGSSFVVPLTINFGPADGGGNEQFFVNTSLSVTDADGNVHALSQRDALNQPRDDGSSSTIESQTIDWDRNAGAVTGNVAVDTTSTLEASNGQAVAGPTGSNTRNDPAVDVGGR